MFEIEIEGEELFDETNNEFIQLESQKLLLEHSLISISKWESKWKKPFFNINNEKKTIDELVDYVRCMTINKGVDPLAYKTISMAKLNEIVEYMDDSMTATWFNEPDEGKSSNREVLTSEVIYYYMFKCGIPMECEKWHFNRLMTLIKVFGAKDGTQKKMSKGEILRQNKALNEARKKKLNSKG